MIDSGILKKVQETQLVDTHEHLVEETTRLTPGDYWALNDIGILFSHYVDNDLLSAGMSPEDLQKGLKLETEPEEKMRLFLPWWPYLQHAGYGRAVTESVRILYGEQELTSDNWRRIDEKIRSGIKPGYYEPILKEKANLHHTQVNSLEKIPFCESQYPELLRQDISFLQLSSTPAPKELSEISGIDVRNLNGFLQVIDWVFEKYGRQAVAIKNQAAYLRRLDYTLNDKADAERAFDRFLQTPESLSPVERKPFEDYLFHVCIDKAIEYDLPVKLHTGYYAGTGHMPLHRVSANPGDVTDILARHPKAKFILMHTMYPYQDEAIAIAKHYPNAVIDMCWSWIVTPAACVRFLKEIIAAAPSNKVLTFGGDYAPVELVPGHAAIARQGIAQAVSELVAVGWLEVRDVDALLDQIMWRTALDLLPDSWG